MKDEPAFPVPAGPNNNTHPGMTLRDYFASNAPQPTMYQIGEALGWPVEELTYGDEETPIGNQYEDSFGKRWAELPSKTKFRVEAELAYMFADAMIEVRQRSI